MDIKEGVFNYKSKSPNGCESRFYFYPGISARYHKDQGQLTLTVVVWLEKLKVWEVKVFLNRA